MYVNVFTGSDICNHFSDIFAVFDDGVSHLKILEGQLVPQGDGLAGRDLQALATIQARPPDGLTRLHIQNGHADVVANVMNQNVYSVWMYAKNAFDVSTKNLVLTTALPANKLLYPLWENFSLK